MKLFHERMEYTLFLSSIIFLLECGFALSTEEDPRLRPLEKSRRIDPITNQQLSVLMAEMNSGSYMNLKSAPERKGQEYEGTGDPVNFCVKSDKFLCDDGKKCIPLWWVGDYWNDCPDGEDESRATEICDSKGGTMCLIFGACMPPSYLCDGYFDCPFDDDEWKDGCQTQEHKCVADNLSYQCQNSLKCLPTSYHNDGSFCDCPEGDDEMDGQCPCLKYYPDGGVSQPNTCVISAEQTNACYQGNQEVCHIRRGTKNSCLHAHNILRQMHGTQNLVWNPTIAQEAENWARDLVNAAIQSGSDQLLHDPDRQYGENLYYQKTAYENDVCARAVFNWYKEIKYYDFATGSSTDNSPIGQFTQLMWKSSTQLGCGIVNVDVPGLKSDSKKYFVVCKYSPIGNIIQAGNDRSQFLENVKASLIGAQTIDDAKQLMTVDILKDI